MNEMSGAIPAVVAFSCQLFTHRKAILRESEHLPQMRSELNGISRNWLLSKAGLWLIKDS